MTRNKKKASENRPEVEYLAPISTSFSITAGSARYKSLLDIGAVARGASAGEFRKWKYFLWKLQGELIYCFTVELFLVIAESGAVFTDSDVVVSTPIRDGLDSCIDKNFSITRLGSLYSDIELFKPKNAADGERTWYSKPRLLNLTKYINTLAKREESAVKNSIEAWLIGIAISPGTGTLLINGSTKQGFDEVSRGTNIRTL